MTAAEQLTQRGRARLRAGLAAGDPGGEATAAWQGKELLRAVYAADGANNAQQGLEHFYRWADGIGVPELSRLARTVKTWEAEILAVHPTNGCSNARRQWQTHRTASLRGRSPTLGGRTAIHPTATLSSRCGLAAVNAAGAQARPR